MDIMTKTANLYDSESIDARVGRLLNQKGYDWKSPDPLAGAASLKDRLAMTLLLSKADEYRKAFTSVSQTRVELKTKEDALDKARNELEAAMEIVGD